MEDNKITIINEFLKDLDWFNLKHYNHQSSFVQYRTFETKRLMNFVFDGKDNNYIIAVDIRSYPYPRMVADVFNIVKDRTEKNIEWVYQFECNDWVLARCYFDRYGNDLIFHKIYIIQKTESTLFLLLVDNMRMWLIENICLW